MQDLEAALFSQWSIDKSMESAVSKAAKPMKKPPQWEHWDDFMEQEFGDMDAGNF
jgi:hypothetical protein